MVVYTYLQFILIFKSQHANIFLCKYSLTWIVTITANKSYVFVINKRAQTQSSLCCMQSSLYVPFTSSLFQLIQACFSSFYVIHHFCQYKTLNQKKAKAKKSSIYTLPIPFSFFDLLQLTLTNLKTLKDNVRSYRQYILFKR